MNNQEPQNQSKITEEANVQNRRRFIKGATAATPVVLTLASPSVLGGLLCLSQQLSGNLSGTPVGGCVKGKNPAYWKSPLNKGAWPSGFSYGTGTSTSVCSTPTYSGGTRFNDSSVGFIGDSISTIMREILCGSITNTNACFTAALLNSVAVPNYILTKSEVLALRNGSLAPPSPFPNTNAGKVAFFQTTW
ncbi:MAG: twin-arginine translocation signal domain-containing protein [Methylococcales bacterium]|nr:twin-arginine translocation signal domain-containing protein [Methylococcales bacterium]